MALDELLSLLPDKCLSMRILLAHNFYQLPGGEDVVYRGERQILEQAGHDIFAYERNNDEISHYSLYKKIKLFKDTIWNSESKRDIEKIIQKRRPEIIHFTNTFPLISPAVYSACQKSGIPVVQTLQNYRLFCLNATFMRNGLVCEACNNKFFAWPGIMHACYRNSYAQSSVVASMQMTHRILGTWEKHVDIFIAATEFSKRKFVQGGIPKEKIAVKPNFIYPDPGPKTNSGEYVLFAGRIAKEKGVRTLIHAWRNLPSVPLKIVGDGELLDEIITMKQEFEMDQVELLGFKPRDTILKLLKDARFLVFPSEWFEGFPLIILEAFASGVPIITTELGGMVEIIEDTRTGMYFSAGDIKGLAEKAEWLWNHPEISKQMGKWARIEFEEKYTAEKNYQQLIAIYELVLDRNGRSVTNIH